MIHSERTFARVAELQRQARAALPKPMPPPTQEELALAQAALAKIEEQ
jgi:hypothetical protein